MTSSQVQRTGLPRTVLFVDVCGSTKLYETLGNARAQAIIGKTLAILSQSATRHLGTIVKTIGDEVMCTFSSAREAAEAAVDMQRCVKQATATEEMGIKSLAVRVGFHSGPVISHAEDVFGDTVNVAARLEQATKRWGTPILASAAVVGAAGEADRWCEVSDEPLPGRSERLAILAPVGAWSEARSLPVTGSAATAA